MLSQIAQLLYAIAVLAAFVLIFFGTKLALRQQGKERLRGGLMIAAALVTLLNVYLYARAPLP
jgi:hypothetical protein